MADDNSGILQNDSLANNEPEADEDEKVFPIGSNVVRDHIQSIDVNGPIKAQPGTDQVYDSRTGLLVDREEAGIEEIP